MTKEHGGPYGIATRAAKALVEAHTPGPRKEACEYITASCGCKVSAQAEIVFCPMHAAAPELLAAAETVLRSLDLDDDDRLEWTGDQRKILRAAIAKARQD